MLPVISMCSLPHDALTADDATSHGDHEFAEGRRQQIELSRLRAEVAEGWRVAAWAWAKGTR